MSPALSMRRMRADALLREPTTRVPTAAAVHARLAQRWAPETIDQAIADLVADGVLAEGPYGELLVAPNAHRTAA